jgi:hypothetical protein
MMAVSGKTGSHKTIVTLPKGAVLTIDGNLDAEPLSALTAAVYQGKFVSVFLCDLRERSVATETTS